MVVLRQRMFSGTEIAYDQVHRYWEARAKQQHHLRMMLCYGPTRVLCDRQNGPSALHWHSIGRYATRGTEIADISTKAACTSATIVVLRQHTLVPQLWY
eukprot:2646056-Rhodomonas_salina.1